MENVVFSTFARLDRNADILLGMVTRCVAIVAVAIWFSSLKRHHYTTKREKKENKKS